jgi:abequosyltransferase
MAELMELSICIPTHNRAGFLRECLTALESEVRNRCEVIIVDGGSTDNTADVVGHFSSRIRKLKYIKCKENRGVDAGILLAIESASSEYCWLFSDDDCIETGSIDLVSKTLARYPQISGISVHSTAYDHEMRYPVATVPAAGRSSLTQDHYIASASDAFSILGIHFGFLSCQVIQRKLWLDVVHSVDLSLYIGSCWLMVLVIGHMLQRQPGWLYLHRSCLRYRTANDSFVRRLGVWNRQLLTHVEFFRILGPFFPPGSSTYRAVQSILVHDRMPRTLADLKANGLDMWLQARLFGLYTRRYYSHIGYWLKVVPLFFVPGLAFRLVRKLYFRRQTRLLHSYSKN